ncbi:hypothetical protein [Calothrix rhizosoleniae]|uniref:hypothetical protein n=1 Tax=Calothrix rhizosoleniae TaxID=888997 RepID=UPI001F186622|nr:hypothetical protein [Calothrix rhizosoleniae]
MQTSRHRALGDFKRIWRDSKTTSVAQPNEVSRNPLTLGRGGMSQRKLHIQAIANSH